MRLSLANLNMTLQEGSLVDELERKHAVGSSLATQEILSIFLQVSRPFTPQAPSGMLPQFSQQFEHAGLK